MNRITTKPAPAPARPPQPAPSFFASTLFLRLHLGLTALLLLGFLAFVVLAASGSVRLGKQTATADKDAKKTDPDSSPKDKEDDKVGRYQIEVVDDASYIVNETGKRGLFGDGIREAWVFRYRGGFIECNLETDFGGKANSAGQVPDWSRLPGSLPTSKEENPDALYKEGYIVVAGMIPTVSVEQALAPFHPHFGAMFTTGPAGPIHGLIPYFHEVWRLREYRLFISAGPPKGKKSSSFNLKVNDPILIRNHFVSEDAPDEPAHTLVGKNLDPGKELTLLESKRGLSVIRLKARFLTDAEVIEKANAKPD